ncbi:MAG: FHA domain-containing protein, partial [Planctomycetota bacterium]
MAARLWIREENGRIREFPLESLLKNSEQGVVIGRDEGADIVILDQAVSRFHARLVKRDGLWSILDLDSSNKTFLNGDPVREGQLEAGDHVGIGDCELLFIDEVTRSAGDSSQTQVLARVSGESELASSEHAASVLATLYRLARECSEMREDSRLLEGAIRVLVEGLQAHRGAVLLIEGETLLCRATHSHGEQALRGFVLSQTIYRELMQSREAILSRDTTADRRFQQQASVVGEEIRSVIAAPILLADRIGGILYLDRLQGVEENFDSE